MNAVRGHQPPARSGLPVVRSRTRVTAERGVSSSRAGRATRWQRCVEDRMTNSETSVLITGGNKGLGFEAARRLGERGWTIFLGARDEGRGRAAAVKLTDGGANVVMVPLDVTSDESVTDAVRLVREHTDRLDVLINNAGA